MGYKFVKEIKFKLCEQTFKNVYYDRYNSIFVGFYVVATAEQIKKHCAYKVDSTERFGSQDIAHIFKHEELLSSEKQQEQMRLAGTIAMAIEDKKKQVQKLPQGEFCWDEI